MIKLAFGCGSFPVPGWENHDLDVDLAKTLPYADASIDFIFSEHCLEHLKPIEAWSYLEECLRILKPGGVVRTTVPSIVKVQKSASKAYDRFAGAFGDPKTWSTKHLIFHHGHQSVWTSELLAATKTAIGFIAKEVPLYESGFESLRNVEQHWKSVGREVNDAESISVEGVKS